MRCRTKPEHYDIYLQSACVIEMSLQGFVVEGQLSQWSVKDCWLFRGFEETLRKKWRLQGHLTMIQ
jgi:hypothetical protein